LLKKYPFQRSTLPWDPKERAIAKWRDSEVQCKDTNERLRDLSHEDTPSWVPRARKLIASVLGNLTPDCLMNILRSGHHGPGSTLSSNGNRVTPYYKYADLPYTVSSSCRFYAYAAISSDPKWIDFLESTGRRTEIPPAGSPQYQKELMLLKDVVVVRDSDKVTFVPKDCRTDRPIAVGASLNLFIQLGVKAYMEKRLKLVGVDLTSQETNRIYARYGSSKSKSPDCPNQFSTIDLASASDTISTGLVKLLLNDEWFSFLDDIRHKSGTLGSEAIYYEKFSAMGNGFTFPLESLIFWAVSKAAIEDAGSRCKRDDIAVFGDDIIIRYEHVDAVISALNWSGFTVNTEKSYLSGFFKESCGEDYYLEHNVRPFYLKREVITYADIYHCANWMSKKILSSNFNTRLNKVYEALLEEIPKKERSYGPISSGKLTSKSRFSSDICEDLLEVPFRFMSSQGLRPWLGISEKESLVRSKLMEPDVSLHQSPVAIRSFVVPVAFKAMGRINYMITLRSHDGRPPWPSYNIHDCETKAMGRHTSRRDAVKVVTRVLSIPNWDKHYSYHELRRHPANFIH